MALILLKPDKDWEERKLRKTTVTCEYQDKILNNPWETSAVWKAKHSDSHTLEGQVLFQEINDDFTLGNWLTM